MIKRLKDLIINEDMQEAPSKTERYTKHYEWTIAIGKDEVATITMSEEAFEELKKLTLEYKDD